MANTKLKDTKEKIQELIDFIEARTSATNDIESIMAEFRETQEHQEMLAANGNPNRVFVDAAFMVDAGKCSCGDDDCMNNVDQIRFNYASTEAQYNTLKNSRLDWLLWMSWALSVREKMTIIDNTSVEVNNGHIRVIVYNESRNSVDIIDSFVSALRGMLNITYPQKRILEALTYEKTLLENAEKVISTWNNDARDRSLSSIINEVRTKTTYDAEAIETEIQEIQNQIHNGVTVRTWGWEIEAPAPGDVIVPAGVEAGYDGSVESFEGDGGYDDCQCECRDCRYHECDCDDCENYNDSPDHCGDTDYCYSGAEGVEYRTTGGLIRAQHPGMLELLNQIKDTEKNVTAGTHIHVYARDLSAEQIGVVLGGYAVTQGIWDVIAGRDVKTDKRCETYANIIPTGPITYTIRNKVLKHVGKFNAVNTGHVTTDRGTLEFRQMNCNFDYKRITFMAWMARGLVQAAKNGAKIHEFFKITNIEGLVKLYKKYGYTLENEWVGNTIENPVGSRYNQSRNRVPVYSE